jgi:hypothetical protein
MKLQTDSVEQKQKDEFKEGKRILRSAQCV